MIKVKISNVEYKKLTTPFINLEYKCNGCACLTDNSSGYCGFCMEKRRNAIKEQPSNFED